MNHIIGSKKNWEVGYITLINIVCSVIGFATGIFNARILGPDNYGVIAVITGINTVMLNLLDVRLIDVVGKLYFQREARTTQELRDYRTSVLQICLIGNGFVSVILCCLGFVANYFFLPTFTSTEIFVRWIIMQTISAALINIMNTFVFLQRFSNQFIIMGTSRLIIQIIASSIMVSVLMVFGGLDGYFFGQITSVSVSLIITIGVFANIWKKAEGIYFFKKLFLFAFKDYQSNFRFILMGNFLGYSKLFHRGGDSLLIGYLFDDRITGLYKFARSLTDGLYMLFDALNQVYGPFFYEMLSKKNFKKYIKYCVFFVLGSGLATILFVVLELFSLPILNTVLLNGKYSGIEIPIMILTIPFFFVAGFYLWYWPIFVTSGRTGSFVAVNMVAVVAQYGLVLIFHFYGLNEPSIGAYGYLCYEVIVAVGALSILASRNCKGLTNAYRTNQL